MCVKLGECQCVNFEFGTTPLRGKHKLGTRCLVWVGLLAESTCDAMCWQYGRHKVAQEGEVGLGSGLWNAKRIKLNEEGLFDGIWHINIAGNEIMLNL